LNELKVKNIGQTQARSWLSMDSATITDMNGQPVVPLVVGATSMNADDFTADTTPPALVGVNLSIDDAQIIMSFSETVDSTSTDFSALTFVSSDTLASPIELSLSEPLLSTVDITSYGPTLVLNIAKVDLDRVKNTPELFISNLTSFITFVSGFVNDNSNNPIATTSKFPVATFEEDLTAPELLSFTVDMSSLFVDLSLTFSEPVTPSSIDLNTITLTDAGRNSHHTLVGGSIIQTSADYQVIDVRLTAADANAIKSDWSLGRSIETSHIIVNASLIRDTNSGLCLATELVPTGFVGDATAPTLVAFELDLDTAELYVSFSESIDASTIVPTAFSLQGSANTSTVITLSGTPSTVNATSAIITLSHADMNLIKENPSIANSADTTFLSFTAGAVADTANNAIAVRPSTDAIAPRLFTPDTTSPTLVDFALNMNTGVITLFFSETVNGSSINVEGVTFAAAVGGAGVSLTTSSPEAAYSDSLSITLSLADLNELKRVTGLCTAAETTFMIISSSALVDMNNNNVTAVASQSTTNYTADGTNPTLVSFALDMNVNVLTMSFSETVNASSLRSTEITLRNNATDGADILILDETSAVTNSDNHTLTVLISNSDVDRINLAGVLDVVQETVFMTITNLSVADMDDNLVVATTLEADEFAIDSSPPQLNAFDLNMDTGLLRMSFDEAMSISSLQRELFALLGDATADQVDTFQLFPSIP
jgi:hypothetical protein